jgi:hypothetical protein
MALNNRSESRPNDTHQLQTVADEEEPGRYRAGCCGPHQQAGINGSLRPGPHNLLVAAGFSRRIQAEAEAGSTRKVNLNLQPIPVLHCTHRVPLYCRRGALMLRIDTSP